MATRNGDGPRVAPGPLKGSGSRAPWVILAVVAVAGLALLASIVLTLILLRS